MQGTIQEKKLIKKVPKLHFPGFLDGWDEKKLKEVVDFSRGRFLSKSDFKNDGKYECIHYGELFTEYKEIIKKIKSRTDLNTGVDGNIGDVLMPTSDVTPQGLAKASSLQINDVKLGGDINILRPTLNIDSVFLSYLLNCQKKKIMRIVSGSTVRHIYSKDVSVLKYFFPGKKEQQKISEFLGAVDNWIENLKQQKENFEIYKKGIMQKIFSQEVRFKNDDGKDFPKWEEKRLGEVAKFRRGSFPQPYGLRKWYDDKNGFPFVQVYDVDDNFKLKDVTKRRITQEAKDLSVLTEKGTIILTIQGSIGRIALTQYDACVDRTLLIFESFKMPIDKIFFMHVVFLLFEIEKTKAPGGTIKTITKEALSSFKLSIPSLQEQQKIAEFTTSIDKIIEFKQQQITQAEQWKKGLMQGLFV